MNKLKFSNVIDGKPSYTLENRKIYNFIHNKKFVEFIRQRSFGNLDDLDFSMEKSYHVLYKSSFIDILGSFLNVLSCENNSKYYFRVFRKCTEDKELILDVLSFILNSPLNFFNECVDSLKLHVYILQLLESHDRLIVEKIGLLLAQFIHKSQVFTTALVLNKAIEIIKETLNIVNMNTECKYLYLHALSAILKYKFDHQLMIDLISYLFQKHSGNITKNDIIINSLYHVSTHTPEILLHNDWYVFLAISIKYMSHTVRNKLIISSLNNLLSATPDCQKLYYEIMNTNIFGKLIDLLFLSYDKHVIELIINIISIDRCMICILIKSGIFEKIREDFNHMEMKAKSDILAFFIKLIKSYGEIFIREDKSLFGYMIRETAEYLSFIPNEEAHSYFHSLRDILNKEGLLNSELYWSTMDNIIKHIDNSLCDDLYSTFDISNITHKLDL